MLKLRERHKGRRCFQTAMPADGLIAAHSVKWRRTARPTIAGSSSHTTRSHAPEKGLSRSYPSKLAGIPDPRQAADRYIWIAKACGLRSRSQSTNIFDRALCKLNSSIAPRPQRVKLRGTQWGAYIFRLAPEPGHGSMQWASLKGANSRPMHGNKSRPIQFTSLGRASYNSFGQPGLPKTLNQQLRF